MPPWWDKRPQRMELHPGPVTKETDSQEGGVWMIPEGRLPPRADDFLTCHPFLCPLPHTVTAPQFQGGDSKQGVCSHHFASPERPVDILELF